MFVDCVLLPPNNPDVVLVGGFAVLLEPNALPEPEVDDPNPPVVEPKPDPPKRPPGLVVLEFVPVFVFEVFVLALLPDADEPKLNAGARVWFSRPNRNAGAPPEPRLAPLLPPKADMMWCSTGLFFEVMWTAYRIAAPGRS